MPRIDVVNEVDVTRSFRVEQLAGMFDVPVEQKSRSTFSVDVPGIDEDWAIGLIVGPSGSGKTSVAKKAFGVDAMCGPEWPKDKAVIDCFGELPAKQVTEALSSVGFSSPPAWLRPHWALSNGEQFRCNVARMLAADSPLVVIDEFTSVVDRTVAKIGSAAVAKAVRRNATGRKLVAVSCHYDIAEWLEPDWVVDMATCQLARGRLCRPKIELRICRCSVAAWKLFKAHHYLDAGINPSATCFIGTIDGEPAAFESWLSFFGRTRDGVPAKRGHRRVVLPDFQGIGVGSAMINSNSSMWSGLGYHVFCTTGHPALYHSRLKDPFWRLSRKPGMTSKDNTKKAYGKRLARTRASGRITAGFEYIGPKMNSEEAKKCLDA